MQAMGTGGLPLPHVALALVVVVMWGFNFIVMKHIVSELPPLGATGLRFLLAALPLTLYVRPPRVSWKGVVGFGLWFGVIKFSLLFTAFKAGMPAGLAALILQLQVILTIIVACIWLGERPNKPQWVGIGLALFGVAIIVAGQPSGSSLVPIGLTFAAASAWAVANMILKRQGTFEPVAFAVWSSLFPGIVMTVASLVIEGPSTLPNAILNLSWTGIAALAYLAYPISILSGAIWGYLWMRHSAAAIAPFALLVPVVGFCCSWLVYGEQLGLATVAGAIAIISGLMINIASTHRRASKTDVVQ